MDSRRIIGRVNIVFPSQSLDLSNRIKLDCTQSAGVVPSFKQILNISKMLSMPFRFSLLNNVYVINDGLGADFLLAVLITCSHSSIVIHLSRSVVIELISSSDLLILWKACSYSCF